MMYGGDDFIVMVVGGPNQRTDFHVDPYEEWFYQVAGNMHVNVDRGRQAARRCTSARARSGCCRGTRRTRRSARRPARSASSSSGSARRARWRSSSGTARTATPWCTRSSCRCADIVDDLPPVFEAFYGDEQARTCRNCGTLHPGQGLIDACDDPSSTCTRHYVPQGLAGRCRRRPIRPWLRIDSERDAMIMVGRRSSAGSGATAGTRPSGWPTWTPTASHVQVVSPTPVFFCYAAQPAQSREDRRRIFNDLALEICAGAPDRLVPFCQVPLQDPDAACARAGPVPGRRARRRRDRQPRRRPRPRRRGHRHVPAALRARSARRCSSTRGTCRPRRGCDRWMAQWLAGMPAETHLSILAHDPRRRVRPGRPDAADLLRPRRRVVPVLAGPDGQRLAPPAATWSPRRELPAVALRRPVLASTRWSSTSARCGCSSTPMGRDRVMVGSDYPYPFGERRPARWSAPRTSSTSDDRAQCCSRQRAALPGPDLTSASWWSPVRIARARTRRRGRRVPRCASGSTSRPPPAGRCRGGLLRGQLARPAAAGDPRAARPRNSTTGRGSASRATSRRTRPWVRYHELLREPAAPLVGALPGEVVVMNTLTVNLHLMMISFYRPDRASGTRILIEDTRLPLRQLRGAQPGAGSTASTRTTAVIRLKPRPGEDGAAQRGRRRFPAAGGAPGRAGAARRGELLQRRASWTSRRSPRRARGRRGRRLGSGPRGGQRPAARCTTGASTGPPGARTSTSTAGRARSPAPSCTSGTSRDRSLPSSPAGGAPTRPPGS